ncbi:Npun_F0296 family exosortase-dependent surface protein [Paludisphaera mucosa]|uniref:PEP-CTERM sorting domain-containing protein n=1 Tax=Paludisphaera mucosa TaxID=3030827 RepID=A0ABT6FIL5_9BACT|nr:PEP-CTERM sorting domain-containing protein [Paludisphaera mucosa]MDG3007426.1 PEP-CTERM sorting domain-containing protein [Paludisphaera mucosa]
MRMASLRMQLGIASVVLGLGTGTAYADLVLSVEPPKAQQTSVADVTTEDFDGFETGWQSSLTTAVGTITSDSMFVRTADQYGGAGGVGKYLAVAGDAPTTLTFNTAQSFFGFWWSAADPTNAFAIYSGSTLLASFNPTTALGALDYHYKGNPTDDFSGQDYGEKFAYLDFTGTDGTTFDRIVFMNPNGGSRLELDNFSIRAEALETPPGTGIDGVGVVPEPSSLAMAGASMLAACGFAARRRGRRPA